MIDGHNNALFHFYRLSLWAIKKMFSDHDDLTVGLRELHECLDKAWNDLVDKGYIVNADTTRE